MGTASVDPDLNRSGTSEHAATSGDVIDVQGFYGALAGQRANKGVFITTSSFTTQATEFAASVERVVLVDGQRLTQLMIEHGVGVSHRNVRIAKVDNDYFEE